MFIFKAHQANFVSDLRPVRWRAGLTKIEFLGCLIAVVGGAWLGALYLGVDLKTAAYNTLSEAKLLDKVPAQWRPQAPQDNAMTREQRMATLHEELGSLKNQIAALQAGKNIDTSESASESANTASQAPTKERTLAYWTRLNEIALTDADLQRDAESAFNAANAAKVFAIKSRVSRFAAKEIEAVPTEAVDEEAVKFGRRLRLWYDDGADLYDRAVRIWETPMGPQARDRLNEEWKQADKQHRNEAALVSEKAAAVRGSMSRIYGVEFREFAKPATPPESKETSAKSA